MERKRNPGIFATSGLSRISLRSIRATVLVGSAHNCRHPRRRVTQYAAAYRFNH